MFRHISRTHVVCAVIFAAINGCKPHKQSGATESYVENGVVWAYGSMQVSDIEGPGAVMLKSQTDAQGVDTYQLYGAIQARVDGGIRDLAYGDYHPQLHKFLAYSYQLDYARRANGNAKIVDVYAVLRKAGRSFHNRQRVLLGSARFEQGAALGKVQLANGMRMSLIAGGVYAGQWVLHYPEVEKVVVKPFAGMCPRFVTQMPGQNPGQNPNQTPGQSDSCKPLPPKDDLCNGEPTRDGCRPTPPRPQAQQANPQDPNPQQPTPQTQRIVSGLELVSGEKDVYAMGADTKEAKIVFASAVQPAASDEENAAQCERKFNAVARTVGRQVNSACVLKPAPASPVNGKLSCGVSISFDRAETYLEKVCDVVATFKGAPIEAQTVQVLKR